MTPFGIRKKLKSLLGGGKSADTGASERPAWEVRVTAPDGSDYTVQGKQGETLVTVSGRGAYPIMTGCAEGDCGTCRVEVLAGAGSVSSEGSREQNTRQTYKVQDGWRLGCQARLEGPGLHLRIVDPFADQPAA
ncbi:(2Fe-2S)-binding protein [Myxococcota bacterium]|nr:(2Fe-2S)-binding protein [Myxococcota bacterium]